ncbi:helix-turn-helix transcriptional regulator [Clostridioides sp. ES-S-0001-02]|nr:helix-turn-helix transcriptional regulator [Clostridioides sp. ES-S-0001-02]MCC0764079.1 helix-turn-helix transcriptional regulator [Clostridioides sp. ES-S-0006-03]UDN60214.1 helix-turn-helix transcriptional regulator [Clostridioides sp. ES-S-0010-02]
MIRTLILYYLNIKPTHGYEIQKFLQVSGADRWTKIQSGSIYYALTKLEKDGLVRVLREEKNGARIRKIYEITQSGKVELREELQKELQMPIVPIGSNKFLLYNILDVLPRDTIQTNLEKHIKHLIEQKKYWENWKEIKKIDKKSLPTEKIAFDMTIDNLNYQILWHEEILNNIDKYISVGYETQNVIKSIDFSNIEEDFLFANEATSELLEVQKLRDEIINNPDKAIENIDKIILKLQNKK